MSGVQMTMLERIKASMAAQSGRRPHEPIILGQGGAALHWFRYRDKVTKRIMRRSVEVPLLRGRDKATHKALVRGYRVR